MSQEVLVELAKLCVEAVSMYGCASPKLILDYVRSRLGRHVLRSDILLTLRALVIAGILRERICLGIHFFCMPYYNDIPPEIREILRVIYDYAAKSSSPLIAISTRAIARRLANSRVRPSSQVISAVLRKLNEKVGVDRQHKKRGKVYFFTRSDLIQEVVKYLDGRVKPEDTARTKFISSEIKQLAEKLRQIFAQML